MIGYEIECFYYFRGLANKLIQRESVITIIKLLAYFEIFDHLELIVIFK